MLADRQCDAIILYTRYMDEPAILSLIDATEMPLVIINLQHRSGRDRYFLRAGDGGIRAVEYLITQGHRYRLYYAACSYSLRHITRGGVIARRWKEYRYSARQRQSDTAITRLLRGYDACRELLEASFSAIRL